MRPPNYLPELDAIRGIAAVGVVLFHAHAHGFFWGWSLVDLFFVLSGFLITRILLCSGYSISATLKRFWLSRVARIWPVYYLVLLIVLAKLWLSQQMGSTPVFVPDNLLSSFFFLQNFVWYWHGITATHIPWFDHSWSLAVEEQFYLLWPLAVLMLRSRPWWLIACCVALIEVAIIVRSDSNDPALLICRVDGLAIGSLLACLNIFSTKLRISAWLMRAFALLSMLFASYVVMNYLLVGYSTVGMRKLFDYEWPILISAFAVLYGFVVFSVVTKSGSHNTRILRHRHFTYLGSISYEIYMVHYPILGLITAQNIRHSIEWSWFSTVLLMASSVACAHLLKAYVADPVQRWKREKLSNKRVVMT